MKKKTKSLLITNEAKPALLTNKLATFTCNLLPKQCRIETLEGRNYTVVPMVILTEGVHAGSSGPVYYPPEELSKTPEVWNHKPVVVYHPEMNGQGISACDPVVINTQKVGLMMNTKWSKNKLTSEAWLEQERADVVDPRVMAAVTANEMMELSTGVFTDIEPTAGEWKGEAYSGIARNYRPDHLALLPDKIGACSIADGAGLLRNQEGQPKELAVALRKVLHQMGFTSNEMSFDNIRENLGMELRKKFNVKSGPDYSGPYLWVENVYSNFVIYEFDGKLFRIGYTSSDTGATLSADKPVEVKRVTEYRTVEGAFVGNQDQQSKKPMNKKELVDKIIGNSSGWTEGDREDLMTMKEERLARLASSVTVAPPAPATPPATTNKETATPAPASAPANVIPMPAAVTNAPQTVDDYIRNAPAGVQDVLRNSLDMHNEEKARLVDLIVANKQNGFSKEELGNKPLGELKKLANLAAPAEQVARPVNYSGMAPTPSTNAKVEAPLSIPTINFDAPAKKAS